MAKLGTEKHPVIVRVKSQERAAAVADLCETAGWRFIVGIEPDEPEDLTDLERASGRDIRAILRPQMVPFQFLFPEVASRETRSLIVQANARQHGIPSGTYVLEELYCVEPGCDCRRVMIWVIHTEEERKVATINHSFIPGRDRDIGLDQTFLDPLHPQEAYAPALLDLFRQVACDRTYRERLERHYRLVKEAVADPAHPVHRRIAEELREPPEPIVRERVAWGEEPYDQGLKKPCPCGSGKKYKRCCWRR